MIFKLDTKIRLNGWGVSPEVLFGIGLLPFVFYGSFYGFSLPLFLFGSFTSLLWAFLISRGFYTVRTLFFWTCILGLTVELIMALREKNIVQMFIAAIAVVLVLALFHWLERQLQRAYHNPGVYWFEGLPQFFPRVQVEVFWNDEWRKASLRKIDHHGMFLFLQKSESESESFKLTRAIRKARFPIKISYRSLNFEGESRLKAVFYERWLGMGLQICPKDLYHFTQYSKIVQNLKGEGYAT